jgi:SAM-dependent methyltransferase
VTRGDGDRGGAAAVERARLEAIRRRHESPERYIEYQRLAGAVVWERITRLMPARGARVLEVGCGMGGIVLELAARGMRADGLDRQQYDAEALTAARGYAARHGIDARFQLGDAARMPYRDGAFDCIVAASVVEHLDDPGGALREMARVLVPGGLAFIDFPLFHGPYGGHIDDAVKWPWYHLLPEPRVRATLRARGAGIEERLYASLNRMTLGAFRRHVRASGLRVRELGRIHHLTHPGRKLLVGLVRGMRAGSPREMLARLGEARRDFTLAEAAAFPFLAALVPLSYLPWLEEIATTGVRCVLERPAAGAG